MHKLLQVPSYGVLPRNILCLIFLGNVKIPTALKNRGVKQPNNGHLFIYFWVNNQTLNFTHDPRCWSFFEIKNKIGVIVDDLKLSIFIFLFWGWGGLGVMGSYNLQSKKHAIEYIYQSMSSLMGSRKGNTISGYQHK